MIEKVLEHLNTIYDGDEQWPDIQFYREGRDGVVVCNINRNESKLVARGKGPDHRTALAKAIMRIIEELEARLFGGGSPR